MAAPRKAKLEGTLHAHRCERMGHRYEDACRSPEIDRECVPCRGGHEQPPWATGRDPVACCFTESRIATKEQVALYKLGGRATWWICKKCARTHPFQPKEQE